MDVDGNTDPTVPRSDGDIDTSFLQQFSCLGTTDHDELVSQLQKILGNQLNYTTARFFLDMVNWNLQAAVGCYFDFNAGQKLPFMKILADVTVGEGEAITPNTSFVQSWKVQNSGDETWPAGCYLKCTSHPEEPDIPINLTLNPGMDAVISINVISPSVFGSFQRKWRMCTSYGTYFGDIMWLIVLVTESGTLALTQQLSSLHTTTNTQNSVTGFTTDGAAGAVATVSEQHGASQMAFNRDLQITHWDPHSVANSNVPSQETQQLMEQAAQQPLPDDSEMW